MGDQTFTIGEASKVIGIPQLIYNPNTYGPDVIACFNSQIFVDGNSAYQIEWLDFEEGSDTDNLINVSSQPLAEVFEIEFETRCENS